MPSTQTRCPCLPCTFGAAGQCDAKRPDLGQLDVAALARVLAKQGDDPMETTEATECETCDGKRTVTFYVELDSDERETEPCPDCAEVRS